MPRQARLDSPGTLQHVILRGIDRKKIVSDDADRDHFVSRMGQVALQTGTAIYAWALIPNHVHVLIETWGSAGVSPAKGWPLAGVIQSWKSFTAKAINQLLGRGGEFWQREYYDRYIRDDRHLQCCHRIHRKQPSKGGTCAKRRKLAFFKRLTKEEMSRRDAGAPREALHGTPALHMR
jgi:REP element-mobilizing transposase RayT